MHEVARPAQRRYLPYVDADTPWNPIYAKAIGVNVDDLLTLQPTPGNRPSRSPTC